jgi:integrase
MASHCPTRATGSSLRSTWLGLETSRGIAFGTPLQSRLVMAGVDLRTVQELLGHKSIAMTVRYSHLAPAHTLAAVERLAETTTEVPTGTKTSTNTAAA